MTKQPRIIKVSGTNTEKHGDCITIRSTSLMGSPTAFPQHLTADEAIYLSNVLRRLGESMKCNDSEKYSVVTFNRDSSEVAA